MLNAVTHARERVSIESFIFSDGHLGDQFVDALAAAAGRGVSVRVVLDAYGADLSRTRVADLTRAGVKVVWFNTLRPWTLEETNYRTHRKILVVDGRIGFTGGAGFADHWRGDARTPEEWRDTQFRVTGPAVRALEAAFYENWLESGGSQTPVLDPQPPAQGGGAPALVVWSNPTAGISNVKLLYLLSLAAAQRTIDIQSPYFVLDASTQGVLRNARKRGVRVRLLTDGDHTDAWPVKYASRHAYAQLLQEGFEIAEYRPTMMHVKATIVDGIWSIIGSANFDNRSFELNDEITMAVRDAGLAQQLTAAFERDRGRSAVITVATWSRRPIGDRGREFFWSLFDEVF